MVVDINKVNTALSLAIPTNATKDHNHQDLTNLMESYGIIEKAKDCFVNGEITFEEYITLCEKHEVNVDNYLETIEHNLARLNLM